MTIKELNEKLERKFEMEVTPRNDRSNSAVKEDMTILEVASAMNIDILPVEYFNPDFRQKLNSLELNIWYDLEELFDFQDDNFILSVRKVK